MPPTDLRSDVVASFPGHRPGGEQVVPRPTAWSVVDDPPPVIDAATMTTTAIVERLRREPPSGHAALDFDDARPAAVLVLLADDDQGRPSVLLTRRSQHLRSHRGEMSFPGGRLDPGEQPVDAALREAHEEVGLDPSLVEIVGELDHLATVVSRSYIVPVVGRTDHTVALEPASLDEVERVLWVPLAEFLRADTFRIERWGKPPATRRLYFFELDDETVWGATGFMLYDLLRRLT